MLLFGLGLLELVDEIAVLLIASIVLAISVRWQLSNKDRALSAVPEQVVLAQLVIYHIVLLLGVLQLLPISISSMLFWSTLIRLQTAVMIGSYYIILRGRQLGNANKRR